MPTEIIFPKVDMDMTEGKIAKWHVAEGAVVAKGAPLFEIETDKAAMEIESPVSGVLRDVRAAEGVAVAVGSAVAFIYAEGETSADVPRIAPKVTVPLSLPQPADQPIPAPAAKAIPAPAKTSARTGPATATPLARSLAREMGVALDGMVGSGPRGRVQADDLLQSKAVTDVLSLPQDTVQKSLPALHLVRKGDQALAPVVFIHGFGSERSIWKTTLSALDPAMPVAELDLPAHGKSPLGSVESFEDIVEAVAQSLDHAQIGACHLVGHSFGGVVAMALAAQSRVSVRSLMLIAPAGLGPDIEREFLQGFTRATRVESLMPWLRLLYAKPSLVTQAFAKAILDGRQDETLRAQQRQILDTMFPDGTQAIDLSETLAGLMMPCKVIWGRQDRIIPVAHSANLPGNVALHLMADTGHLPHLEQPAMVARLIAELVKTA
jgi:pimeloyl-ACP methyl ester carboxylesterase